MTNHYHHCATKALAITWSEAVIGITVHMTLLRFPKKYWQLHYNYNLYYNSHDIVAFPKWHSHHRNWTQVRKDNQSSPLCYQVAGYNLVRGCNWHYNAHDVVTFLNYFNAMLSLLTTLREYCFLKGFIGSVWRDPSAISGTRYLRIFKCQKIFTSKRKAFFGHRNPFLQNWFYSTKVLIDITIHMKLLGFHGYHHFGVGI